MRNTTLDITMPRRNAKRKLNLSPSEPTPIPFIKYRVNWIDIVSDSGWADDREFNRMRLSHPVNEGWLFSKDKHHIKVFASYDKDADTKEITFGDRTMIPLSCVKKMIKLD